ncbi:MAG: hypothetical protein LBV26_09375 [Bacteroidales bacterium]|jgi:hypothetical protein|nr:hypothetical protein [Bacteroidales bacterium]
MKTYVKIFLIMLSIASVSCRKEHIIQPPGISTLDVTNITATSAVCGGELESLDNAGLLGISWGTGKLSLSWNGTTWKPNIGGSLAKTIDLQEADVYVTAMIDNNWQGVRIVMK